MPDDEHVDERMLRIEVSTKSSCKTMVAVENHALTARELIREEREARAQLTVRVAEVALHRANGSSSELRSRPNLCVRQRRWVAR